MFVVEAPFGSEEAIVLERLPVYERQDAPWPQSVPILLPQGVEFIAGDAKEAMERMQEKLTEAGCTCYTNDSQGDITLDLASSSLSGDRFTRLAYVRSGTAQK